MAENQAKSGDSRGIKAKNAALERLREHATAAADTLVEIMNNGEMPTRERRFAAIAILDRVGVVPGVHVESSGGSLDIFSGLTFPELIEVINECKRKRD